MTPQTTSSPIRLRQPEDWVVALRAGPAGTLGVISLRSRSSRFSRSRRANCSLTLAGASSILASSASAAIDFARSENRGRQKKLEITEHSAFLYPRALRPAPAERPSSAAAVAALRDSE